MSELIRVEAAEVSAQAAVTPDMFSRFIAFLDVAPKSVETYAKAVRQLSSYFSAHGITRPTREDIVAFREELKAAHKPATVNAYIVAARLFFQWLEQEHLYPNVAAHVKGVKLDRGHKRDYLTSKQIKTVFAGMDHDTTQGKRDFAIMALMITGGLRTIEIVRANVEDLRAVGDSPAIYLQGKGHTERTQFVKLDASVEGIVRDYLKARGECAPDAPLFASLSNNNKGQRMTTRAVSGIAKAAMKAAGYNSPRLTAHSCRHSAVTLALLAGQSITEVQQFARHQSVETTMVYNHAIDAAKNTCSESIARAIF